MLPPFLNGRQRFTQSDANQSRNVTKIRWVVEAINGRMKQFKFLANTIQNSSLPHLEQYLLIICAIINRYQRPMKTSTPDDVIIADKMIKLSKQKKNFELVSISIS
jgi:DDE superfamily endonuclease